MGDAIRAFDWSQTPLGPRSTWPQSLRVAIGLCLNSRFPMFLWWGPNLINLYNDAYIPILGKRQPQALGGDARELWQDVWPGIAPQVEAVFERGEASWQERLLLVTNRNGYDEDAYFTYSHSPVFDEHGGVAGLICVVAEETAHVRAEEELRQSEERLRALITASSYALYCVSPDWSEMRQLDGRGFLSEKEIASRVWLQEYIYSDDRPKVLAAIQEAIRTRSMFELEHRVRRVDGSLGWTLSRAIPLLDIQGEITEWIAAASDITPRRQAEQALAASEERLQQVFAQAPVAVAVLRGRELVFELANAAYREFVPGRELLGRPLQTALPELGSDLVAILNRVLDTGEPFVGVEYLVPLDRDRDGVLEDHWFTFAYQPWRQLDGSMAGIVVIAVEVSTHVRARRELERVNQELRESQVRLRTVMEQMPSGLFIVEAPSGRIIAHNTEAAHILGHPAIPSDDYRGYRDYGALHANGTPYAAEEYPTARALLHGEVIRQEPMRYQRGDGSVVYLAVNAAPVRDEERVVAAVCTFHDISEQEEAREALRASQARQAFLLALSDAIRPLRDPEAVKEAASRVLGEQLRVNRAFYAEVDRDDWVVEGGYTQGVEPLLPGRYAAETYGRRVMDTYRAGQNIVFRDTRTDPGFTPAEREAHVAINILGAVGVPLMKEGKLVAILAVHTTEPRDWTGSEIALVEETAERTWAAVQRAKAESALQRREAQYRSLFDSIDQGFCLIEMLFDPEQRPIDYRFIEINPSFEQQTGLKDACGRTARELVPGLEQHWFDIYGQVAHTGEPVRFVNRSEPMGRWFEVYAFRSGRPEEQRVALLFSDITARQQTEAALRHSEERFRTFVTMSSAVVWITDSGGNIVEENPSVAAFTGRTFDEYKGWGWLEDIHPDDREQTGAAWSQALATRTLYNAEYRLHRHDGVYRHVVARGAPVLEADGVLREWVGTCTDIHERVLARRKLEFLDYLAEATRELADPAEVMIVITRLLGEHLQVSRCAYADVEADTDHFTILHDYTVEGVASTAGHYHLSLFGSRAAADQREGRTLVVQDVDRELAPADGADMFNAIGIKAIICCPLLKQGRLTAMMAVHQTTLRAWTADEVSLVEATVERAWAYIERSRAMRTLQESNQHLARTNRELEEFAYVASHDLQEPLRMVNIYSQLLLRHFVPDDPRAREYAGFVTRGVQRMQELVRDLLNFSRTVQHDETPIGAADLSASLAEAISVLTIPIEESGARITAGPLPDVRGDTKQLAHVFQNLLNNALKYRKANVTPDLRITATQMDGQWIIAVEDNGIGFDQQYAERIFGLFKRLHKDEYPGTGLGLAICQRIIERYGGRMWAEGRLGQGATFFFALPAAEAE